MMSDTGCLWSLLGMASGTSQPTCSEGAYGLPFPARAVAVCVSLRVALKPLAGVPGDWRRTNGHAIGATAVAFRYTAPPPGHPGPNPHMTSHAECVACWFLSRRQAPELEAKR